VLSLIVAKTADSVYSVVALALSKIYVKFCYVDLAFNFYASVYAIAFVPTLSKEQ